jgi:hypothetical protein
MLSGEARCCGAARGGNCQHCRSEPDPNHPWLRAACGLYPVRRSFPSQPRRSTLSRSPHLCSALTVRPSSTRATASLQSHGHHSDCAQSQSESHSYCSNWHSRSHHARPVVYPSVPLVATPTVVAVTTTSTSRLSKPSGELLCSPPRLDCRRRRHCSSTIALP